MLVQDREKDKDPDSKRKASAQEWMDPINHIRYTDSPGCSVQDGTLGEQHDIKPSKAVKGENKARVTITICKEVLEAKEQTLASLKGRDFAVLPSIDTFSALPSLILLHEVICWRARYAMRRVF